MLDWAQAAFLAARRCAALGDFCLACAARFPPRAICFFLAFSRSTGLPPFLLAGFLRQLPSSCSFFPGTGSYPGQHREVLVSFFLVAMANEKSHRQPALRASNEDIDCANSCAPNLRGIETSKRRCRNSRPGIGIP